MYDVPKKKDNCLNQRQFISPNLPHSIDSLNKKTNNSQTDMLILHSVKYFFHFSTKNKIK